MSKGKISKTSEAPETTVAEKLESMAQEASGERRARQILSNELRRTKSMTVAMAAFLSALSRPDKQPRLLAIKAETLVGAAELLEGLVASIKETLKVAGV